MVQLNDQDGRHARFSYKPSKKNLLQNYMNMKLEHYVLKLHKVYINHDPMSTLTHLKTMSDLAKLDLVLIVGPGIR